MTWIDAANCTDDVDSVILCHTRLTFYDAIHVIILVQDAIDLQYSLRGLFNDLLLQDLATRQIVTVWECINESYVCLIEPEVCLYVVNNMELWIDVLSLYVSD